MVGGVRDPRWTEEDCGLDAEAKAQRRSAAAQQREASLVPRELNFPPLVFDPPVATTDQPQSPWLPPSASSLTASTSLHSQQQAHQQQLPPPPLPPALAPSEDFVLFPPEPAPSRPAQAPPSSSHGFGLNTVQQRQRQRFLASPRTPALDGIALARRRRHHHQSQQQLAYGPFSAPNNSAAANARLPRRPIPPVPAFPQSANTASNMELGTATPRLQPFSDLTARSHFPRADIDLPDFASFGAGTPISEFPSPANPGFGLDLSGSLHNSVTSVSPNDLLLTDNIFSAPNSAALSQLTTPSVGYNTSPEFGYDCSPLFQTDDLDAQQPFWSSLFPDAATTAVSAAVPAAAAPSPSPPQQQQQSLAASIEQSPATESEDLEIDVQPRTARKPSDSFSPSDRRHSSTSGVSARRRGRPLPPITIDDPSDMVGMKRAKNTLAARKSRARKAERMDELEQKVRELEAEKEKLEAQVAHWKSLASARG
ncbi:hypothetical protein BD289DRAFT_485301 [Coniella lustricola]|uniref:Cross-pathway control protein 1 n=1 Tax=Coniella lustricola TaxID=2025994 RepID=A0A2T2ZZ82_9PEZI|nr:hypothetical protein BD289DRAFT_485301 [Coniella lustricola]